MNYLMTYLDHHVKCCSGYLEVAGNCFGNYLIIFEYCEKILIKYQKKCTNLTFHHVFN